jgi:demethylmenaquinone methyltransferase/2-methoxy-6-polyprenyl-1,4-benzoquinol methylase
VVGVDPSTGMLREARRRFAGPLVQGRAEALPFADARFDLLSVGYALRHVPDLEDAFRECLRVLKPGGRLLVLELSRAPSPAGRALLRLYFTQVVPLVMRLRTPNPHARTLMRYYWDTIAACVPPDVILDALRRSGFAEVSHRVFGGVVSEYVGRRPELLGHV